MRSRELVKEKCTGILEKVNWCHAVCQEDRRNEEAATLSLLPNLTSGSNVCLLSVLQVEFLVYNNLCSRCRAVTPGLLLDRAKGRSEFIQLYMGHRSFRLRRHRQRA